MKKILTIVLTLGLCVSSLIGCESVVGEVKEPSEGYRHDIAGYTTVFYKEQYSDFSTANGNVYVQYIVYSNYDKRLYEITETICTCDTYYSEKTPLTEADGTPRYYENEDSIKDFTGGK